MVSFKYEICFMIILLRMSNNPYKSINELDTRQQQLSIGNARENIHGCCQVSSVFLPVYTAAEAVKGICKYYLTVFWCE
jgi:hypothetical protein